MVRAPRMNSRARAESGLPLFQNGCARKSEIKSCAFSGLRFGPHSAAMSRDAALRVRQTGPRNFQFILGVLPLQPSEKFVGTRGIELRAVIAEENDDFAVFFAAANFHGGAQLKTGGH